MLILYNVNIIPRDIEKYMRSIKECDMTHEPENRRNVIPDVQFQPTSVAIML